MWSCKYSPAIRPAQGPFPATGYKRNRKPGKGKGSREEEKNKFSRPPPFLQPLPPPGLRDPAIPREGQARGGGSHHACGPNPVSKPARFPRPSTLILSWRRIRVFGLTGSNFQKPCRPKYICRKSMVYFTEPSHGTLVRHHPGWAKAGDKYVGNNP
jgi:hypothetical protein